MHLGDDIEPDGCGQNRGQREWRGGLYYQKSDIQRAYELQYAHLQLSNERLRWGGQPFSTGLEDLDFQLGCIAGLRHITAFAGNCTVWLINCKIIGYRSVGAQQQFRILKMVLPGQICKCRKFRDPNRRNSALWRTYGPIWSLQIIASKIWLLKVGVGQQSWYDERGILESLVIYRWLRNNPAWLLYPHSDLYRHLLVWRWAKNVPRHLILML